MLREGDNRSKVFLVTKVSPGSARYANRDKLTPPAVRKPLDQRPTRLGRRWCVSPLRPSRSANPLAGSKAYTESAIDASIARLGFAPDAWALHRIDPKVPIEESVTAMEAARQAGKTKYIGLSEVRALPFRRRTELMVSAVLGCNAQEGEQGGQD